MMLYGILFYGFCVWEWF